jgi:hypothetical protein
MSYNSQEGPRTSVASMVLLGTMPLYFLLNRGALYAPWGRVQETLFLFTYVVPVVLGLLLLVVQQFLRPFRWWAVGGFILFLFGAAVLNHLWTVDAERLRKGQPKQRRAGIRVQTATHDAQLLVVVSRALPVG